MRGSIVVATLLGLGTGACGSSGTSTPAGQLHTCAADAGTWVTVAAPDAGAATATAALKCPGSIANYCAGYATGCPPVTWTDAVAAQNATGFPPNLYVCDAYNWADDGWICDGHNTVLFAYDKSTGKMVGAVEFSAQGASQQSCLAGPTTLAPYGGCTAYYNCFPNDAGFPRGNCYGDGGVDASGGGG
jgi:hypothetical protein